MSRQIPSLQSIAQNVIVLYKKVKKKKKRIKEAILEYYQIKNSIKVLVRRFDSPHVDRATDREVPVGYANSEMRIAFLGAGVFKGQADSANQTQFTTERHFSYR